MSASRADHEAAGERIRRAAVALFTARGYHGTPVRALARIVRLEAGSLYHHFPSKQEILADIFHRTMDDLLGGLRAALAGAAGPVERLRAAVDFHVRFHIERQDEAFLSHSELRALSPANLRRVVAKRDRYEGLMRGVVDEGVRTGDFQVADGPLAAIAILTLCSGVADWFSRGGRLDAGAVARAYADMVLRLVRAPAGGRRQAPPHGPRRPRARRPGPGPPVTRAGRPLCLARPR